jgi:hypothetical protein
MLFEEKFFNRKIIFSISPIKVIGKLLFLISGLVLLFTVGRSVIIEPAYYQKNTYIIVIFVSLLLCSVSILFYVGKSKMLYLIIGLLIIWQATRSVTEFLVLGRRPFPSQELFTRDKKSILSYIKNCKNTFPIYVIDHDDMWYLAMTSHDVRSADQTYKDESYLPVVIGIEQKRKSEIWPGAKRLNKYLKEIVYENSTFVIKKIYLK